jgi:DNA-binding transcriptional LysR family regulator
MIDLGRLRALHAVSVHGSVNGAAEALGYTPSAISQQLNKLERETRTTLLERRGRGVVLTDAAQSLADTAAEVLKLVEQAEIQLEEQRGAPVGKVALGAFPTSCRGLLPPVVAELAVEHPALDVTVLEIDPPATSTSRWCTTGRTRRWRCRTTWRGRRSASTWPICWCRPITVSPAAST